MGSAGKIKLPDPNEFTTTSAATAGGAGVRPLNIPWLRWGERESRFPVSDSRDSEVLPQFSEEAIDVAYHVVTGGCRSVTDLQPDVKLHSDLRLRLDL